MLSELSIRNFAIIESLNISFQKGLTVLSGETGAGKSIIIDAISLLVGGRGSAEFVRYGTDKAEIEGLFYIEDEQHPCVMKAEELDIEIEDGMIILKRDISVNGKSVCRVNGKLVTLSTLKEIGKTLVDIHGQHETQDLMNEDRHLFMLDHFEGDHILVQLEKYQNGYREYEQLKKQLNSLTENEQQMAHRLDLIQFQHEEIRNADLKIDEEQNLLEERLKISNFEKIYKALGDSYRSLTEERSGLDHVRNAMNQMESITDLDTAYQENYDAIANSYYLLEEVAYQLREKLDMMEYDPNRLDEIETRLNEIRMLKRKYGNTVEEILAYADEIEKEIFTIENKDVHIETTKKKLKEIEQLIVKEATLLSDMRHNLANRLTTAIHQELKELYMEKTKFEVMIKKKEGTIDDPLVEGAPVKMTQVGYDNVEFYISTNPGEPLKPLSKVASGGELSRIILALKSIFSKHQGVASVIFDEVDTGVSGRVAQAIAEKIYRVSVNSQVLCITHLPQVASMADAHLFIRKQIANERTVTSVTVLSQNEKVTEIARMISGVEITDLTTEHARELLSQAHRFKQAAEAIQ
ncbi:DNA repair protein RecN [Bacillus sp. WLY-B-L8]|uniref:DNA repair protein RecN n=1 Tax=Bacillus multifaciens TaxID=3068506 RepID=UPI0027421884|nr:DNA repair protein RecN [Bacillus sp. WLY-B-L8]MDP7977105.1 DNA repair protein RecN [Bacillus sp. WLY-B-L8]HDX9587841.1 DNA repair protein RecN [Bacillus pseudomycoides]